MAPKLKGASNILIANRNQMVKKGKGLRGSRRQIEEESLIEDSGGNVVQIDEQAGHGEKMQKKQVVRDEAPSIPTRRRVDPYGTDIFMSGRADQPKYPYYVTKINLRHPDWLFVPDDVFKHRIFDLPKNPSLINRDGRKWSTELSKRKDGRTIYRGGWKYFCMTNHVREDDLCIIEFVSMRGRTDIRVNIVRADRSS